MKLLKSSGDMTSPARELNRDEMAEDGEKSNSSRENVPKDDEVEGLADDEMKPADEGSSSSERNAANSNENDGQIPDKMKETNVAPSDAEGIEDGDDGEMAPSDQGNILPQGTSGQNDDNGTDSENVNRHQNVNAGQQKGEGDNFEQEFQQLLEKGFTEDEIEDRLKSKYPSKF
jgi:hypothetical protein